MGPPQQIRGNDRSARGGAVKYTLVGRFRPQALTSLPWWTLPRRRSHRHSQQTSRNLLREMLGSTGIRGAAVMKSSLGTGADPT